jgi:hypothetical protein
MCHHIGAMRRALRGPGDNELQLALGQQGCVRDTADLEIEPLGPGGVQAVQGCLLQEEGGVAAQLVHPGQEAEGFGEVVLGIHERSPLVRR